MRSDDVRELGMGGMLHDVGKVRIARAILNKQGKLTKQEFEEIKKHPDIGVDILKGMNCYGEQVVSMAGQH
ncbi:MAG: HD domain-containing protein, partial [Nitrospinaceae bacterium]|nr:HD domain-containing protein [Nitrospinaceae bacterium]NIR57280.1 HD domain-containing protein [Nitrospinaceae bacterium]NIS87732.1 HD domain-containing protein [Nitrospinaceae bacterium]NIT84598.1 HD domain-containing protein [Nitrospinaceae bacterium]NIU46781.1 HD domain-containing protein [Nitrospinaceae bacterium]